MKKKTKTAAALSLNLRLRIVCDEKIALGPGKVELLAWIDKTGSLGKAAKQMGMSYMKAWSLVQTMKPLVRLARGGQTGGGAQLTETGHQAVALYQKMEQDCLRASQSSWKKLQKLLRG